MSEQSLRDTLEKLVSEIEVSNIPTVSGRDLLDLLAAHRAEPAPVVGDEAVERTAAALWDEVWSEGKDYSEASDAERDECRNSARTILEAALPYLAPKVDRDALIKRIAEVADRWDEPIGSGEADEITDAVLALINGTAK